MQITFIIAEFHVSVARSIVKLGANPALVLDEVNEELSKLNVDVEQKNKDGETKGSKTKNAQVSFSSSLKVKADKADATPALRLARINRWLCESAALYLRVDAVTLPQSVDEWIQAKRFVAESAPVKV